MKGAVILFALVAVVACIYGEVPKCPKPDPENPLAVMLPNPEDCTTFYACAGQGNPVLLPCLNNTWFNPVVGVCDWPANVPEGVCKPPPSN